MKPKISYITGTGRTDFPHPGRPDLHLFEVTLDTLSRQSFQEFEYIVVDIDYDKRPDYFKTHSRGLRIKHLPAGPNVWSEYGLVQLNHQFNKGIAHADGELLFFDADSAMLPPWLLEGLWRQHKAGRAVNLPYGYDLTFVPEGAYGLVRPPENSAPVDVSWYEHLGFKGMVQFDHRWEQTFGKDPTLQITKIHPDWWFGTGMCSLEMTLEINGFEQVLDGHGALADCDFGARLVEAGHREKLHFVRNLFMIEAFAGTEWSPTLAPRTEVICNFALTLFRGLHKIVRANEGWWPTDQIVAEICNGGRCPIKADCLKVPHRKPTFAFYNKDQEEKFRYWERVCAVERIDLREERKLRLAGDPKFKVGTFVNCED